VLDRLANGDLLTAHCLLQLMVDSHHMHHPAAVPEYAPFARAAEVTPCCRHLLLLSGFTYRSGPTANSQHMRLLRALAGTGS
jgi:hypothetical protein